MSLSIPKFIAILPKGTGEDGEDVGRVKSMFSMREEGEDVGKIKLMFSMRVGRGGWGG